MIFRVLALIALLGIAAPASADTTAVYSLMDGRMTMTIEIAVNGDIRAGMGGTMIDEARAKNPEMAAPLALFGYIVRAGEGYFLQPTEDGVGVIGTADAAAVLGEQVKQDEHFSKLPPPTPMKLVEAGEVVIRGRRGTAYFRSKDAGKQGKPLVVISTDPDLAELSRAMSTMIGITAKMGGEMGFGDYGAEMSAVFARGALLSFAGMELVEVRHDAIPAERFALPSAPLSRDQVRALMTRGAKKP